MTVELMKSLARSRLLLRRSVARLRRDTRGVAAVEFAVIVPLMLVMFFGTIEFSSAVAVDRKLSLVAQGLADLVSRSKTVTDVDFTNFNLIANAMLTPYSATPLHATITEIYIDTATGNGHAQWSKGYAPRTAGSTVPVPADLIARDSVTNAVLPNQYLIFTEAKYLYTPTVGYVMGTAGVPLSDQTYMRPRMFDCVLYGTTTCPKS